MESHDEQSPKLTREESASSALLALRKFQKRKLGKIEEERKRTKDRAGRATVNVQLLQSLILIPELRDYVQNYIAGASIRISVAGLLRELGEINVYPDFTEIVTQGSFGQEVNPLYDNSDAAKTREVIERMDRSASGTQRSFIKELASYKPGKLLNYLEKGIRQKPTSWKAERTSIDIDRPPRS